MPTSFIWPPAPMMGRSPGRRNIPGNEDSPSCVGLMSYSSISLRPTISRSGEFAASIRSNSRATAFAVPSVSSVRARSRKTAAALVPLARETPKSAFGPGSCSGNSKPNGRAPIVMGSLPAHSSMRSHSGAPIRTGEILFRKCPSKSPIVPPSRASRSWVSVTASSISMMSPHAITGAGFKSASARGRSRRPMLTGTSYRRPGANLAQKWRMPGTTTLTTGMPISGRV